MGLDQYLYTEIYTGKYTNEELNKKLWKMFPKLSPINLSTIKVVIEVGYWRKANQIHKWFVENVQDGVDNCAKYYVSREQLKELYDLVTSVLKTKEYSKMPTQEGFFFGSTDYDEYYIEDLEHTKIILKEILENESLKDNSFYYQSSL